MNQDLLPTLIGTSGVLIGAILGFLASTLTNRHKIKELNHANNLKLKQLDREYRQKLSESYLANARLHTREVYVPLHKLLTELSEAFEAFFKIHWGTGRSSEAVPDLMRLIESGSKRRMSGDNMEIEEFRRACNDFVKQVSEMKNKGDDALLTKEIHDRLYSFTQFIKESIYYEYEKLKISPSITQPRRRAGAPINSSEFGYRFLIDISSLKPMIAEVVLGPDGTSQKTNTSD